MGSAPGKIVVRVILITLGVSALVAGLGWTATMSPSFALRVAAMTMLGLCLSTGGYLAWVYLPDVDLPGRSPRRGLRSPDGGLRVALTFDDGPNGNDTAAILDALRRHQVRATFFLVGEAARRYPELVRRMFDEGHVIGSHTQTHRKLAWLSRAEVERELDEAARAIVEAGAPRPIWFRAPHGFKSPFLPGALTRRGMRMVAWTNGVWDTDRPGAEVIANRALGCLSDGAILLLHDGTDGADRSQTAAATDRILGAAERRGVQFVTIPEILAPEESA